MVQIFAMIARGCRVAIYLLCSYTNHIFVFLRDELKQRMTLCMKEGDFDAMNEALEEGEFLSFPVCADLASSLSWPHVKIFLFVGA